jgi:hypothetical protein
MHINDILPHIPANVLNNKESVMKVISKFKGVGDIYSFLPDNLKLDTDIIYSVCMNQNCSLEDIQYEKLHLDFVAFLCEKIYYIFQHTGDKIRNNTRIALVAIRGNLSNYKYISYRLASNLDFIYSAVKLNIYVYKFIYKKFKAHPRILSLCLDNLSGPVIEMIPEYLLANNVLVLNQMYTFDNKDVRLRDAILQKDPKYLRFMSNAVRNIHNSANSSSKDRQ